MRSSPASLLAEHERHVGHAGRMSVRFHLWELTGDRTHLEEARRLLAFGLEHSPGEHRTAMVEHVPLHRRVMRAWEEQGGES